MSVKGPFWLRILSFPILRVSGYAPTGYLIRIRTLCKGAVQAICISRLSQQRIVHVVAVASFLILSIVLFLVKRSSDVPKRMKRERQEEDPCQALSPLIDFFTAHECPFSYGLGQYSPCSRAGRIPPGQGAPKRWLVQHP